MNYLRIFLPWILFAAVSAAGWQWGALTGLVLTVLVLGQNRRAGVPRDAQVIELSMLVFFAVLTVVAFAATGSGLKHWTGVLSLGWLGLVSWTGLAAGRPFTLGIARRQAPREVWETPGFRRINTVITTVWAAAFTVTALVLIPLVTADLGSGVTIPVQIAGFAVPAVFTGRYVERVRARAQAAGAPQAPNPPAEGAPER